jgi:hypothetical protein
MMPEGLGNVPLLSYLLMAGDQEITMTAERLVRMMAGCVLALGAPASPFYQSRY